MDTCPTEILDQIFALACTDDGSTGRALSLTSTRIHDISAPYKYFSVNVIGTTSTRMSKFAEFVERYNPHIQYLTLDCAILDGPGPVQDAFAQINSHRKSGGTTRPTRRRPARSEYESVCSRTSAILRVLAPRLKGLYLIPARAPLNLNGFTFPLLDTFYLYDFSDNVSISWTPSHFPSLNRLDVSCDLSGKQSHGSPLCRLQALPALRHLGCCSHIYDGELLSYFFDSLVKSNDARHSAPPKPIPWLSNLSDLEVFRIGMTPARFRSMVVGDPLGVSKHFKEALEKIPRWMCERRDPVMTGTVPMDEWIWAVQGEEGFPPAKGECIPPCC